MFAVLVKFIGLNDALALHSKYADVATPLGLINAFI